VLNFNGFGYKDINGASTCALETAHAAPLSSQGALVLSVLFAAIVRFCN
jgi:hypothetical protein